jgi:hypothetical protein
VTDVTEERNLSQSQRINHIEVTVDGLRSALVDVKTGQATLSGQIAPVMAMLKTIEHRMNQPIQKPPVTAYVTAVVACLVLLGAIGASNLKPLAWRTEAILEYQQNMLARQMDIAQKQAAVIAKVDRTIERVDHLEHRIDDNRDIATRADERHKRE